MNKNIEIEMLFPMWKKYMIEIGEEETDEDLLHGLVAQKTIQMLVEMLPFLFNSIEVLISLYHLPLL